MVQWLMRVDMSHPWGYKLNPQLEDWEQAKEFVGKHLSAEFPIFTICATIQELKPIEEGNNG